VIRFERLECPICLRLLDWSAAQLVTLDDLGEARPFARQPGESDAARRNRLATAYRVCPGDGAQHYLPYDYGDYDERVVVGVVGQSSAGKTHLLAAVIGQLLRQATRLGRLGLQVEPLDLRLHQRYVDQVVEPFLGARRVLDPTRVAEIEFADALRVTNLRTRRRYAVAFFDVAGETLARVDPDVAFVGAVNALLFVVDPESVPYLVGPDAAATGDAAFDMVFNRLNQIRNPDRLEYLPIPAATVVAKSDLLRFRSPLVNRWMSREGDDEELDLASVEEESADVYAFLAARGAERWLVPAERCADSTLHFASAAGARPQAGQFPARAFRQRRVLKPFLSLLAMKGVLDRDTWTGNADAAGGWPR
jgi:hypothetical protein